MCRPSSACLASRRTLLCASQPTGLVSQDPMAPLSMRARTSKLCERSLHSTSSSIGLTKRLYAPHSSACHPLRTYRHSSSATMGSPSHRFRSLRATWPKSIAPLPTFSLTGTQSTRTILSLVIRLLLAQTSSMSCSLPLRKIPLVRSAHSQSSSLKVRSCRWFSSALLASVTKTCSISPWP